MASTSIECSVPGCSFRTPHLPERFYPNMVDQLKVQIGDIVCIVEIIVGIVDIDCQIWLLYNMISQLKTCIVDIVGKIDIVDLVGKINIVGIGTSRLPEHFNPKHSRAAAEAANLNDYYFFCGPT